MNPTITYDGKSVVTATIRCECEEQFADAVIACQTALAKYKRTKPGSDWGCDGIGYHCQRKLLMAVCHRSGVGPRSFKAVK